MNLPVGYYLQNGKYQILQIVGQGGFGITYKGVLFTEVKGQLGTIKTEVPISIKEYFFKDYCYRNADTYSVNIHSETGKRLFDKFKEKLIKEAKILSDVRHPYIVNVLDVFEENNTAYIAMEYISGHSLKYILENNGAIAEEKILKYMYQIGTALQFVHEKNILHLDVKPSNILIDQNDNARLIDFGVSKRYDVEDDKETSTTVLTLSKGFASVEQYDNEGTQTFSPCPDIYSLGATMYNLLTGKIPTESILRATRPLQMPSEFNPGISPKTETVILKAMEVEPDKRYTSIREMMDALDIPPHIQKQNNGSYDNAEHTNLPQDETTLLYSSLPVTGKAKEEEQTLLMDDQAHKAYIKKKKRKKVMVLSLICLFVLIGSSVALLLGHDKFVADKITMPPASANNTPQNTTPDSGIDPQPEETKEPETQTQTQTQTQSVENKPEEMASRPEQPAPVVQTTDEEVMAQYTALIESGKSKLASSPQDAYDDFSGAYRIKESDEALNLMSDAKIRMEEKEIADRLALYEEKFNFGKLKIVRKKSTKKYGAVDSKGEEKIKCIYPILERREEGWAFQREDGIYDIYDSNGNLLQNVGTY